MLKELKAMFTSRVGVDDVVVVFVVDSSSSKSSIVGVTINRQNVADYRLSRR